MGDKERKPYMQIDFAPDGSPVIRGNLNWMQMLVVADMLRMEGEGMYIQAKYADMQGKPSLEVVRGMPGMPPGGGQDA